MHWVCGSAGNVMSKSIALFAYPNKACHSRSRRFVDCPESNLNGASTASCSSHTNSCASTCPTLCRLTPCGNGGATEARFLLQHCLGLSCFNLSLHNTSLRGLTPPMRQNGFVFECAVHKGLNKELIPACIELQCV